MEEKHELVLPIMFLDDRFTVPVVLGTARAVLAEEGITCRCIGSSVASKTSAAKTMFYRVEMPIIGTRGLLDEVKIHCIGPMSPH